jgi:hypothetical protein
VHAGGLRNQWYVWPALRIDAYRGFPPEKRRTVNIVASLGKWFVQVHIEL